MSFILAAKPDDHKIMYKMIENQDKLDNVQELVRGGRARWKIGRSRPSLGWHLNLRVK